MSQPPEQPSQGGFGPPPEGTPSQPPQAPSQPPSQPGPPSAPSAPSPQAGPYGPPPGPYGAPSGPYGAPSGPYPPPQHPQASQQPQPGPYAPQSGPYAPAGGAGFPGQPYAQQPYPGQPPFPGAPAGNSPGLLGRLKGKPAIVAGAVVALALIVGGTVWAVTGGDGDKKPIAGPSGSGSPTSPAPTSASPVNRGDGRGDGDDKPEDFNAGRKPGDGKVLWFKEAPDAPANGADATGMWVTGSTAVKAAYKQVFAYHVTDGAPAWNPVTFPHEICAVSPGKAPDDTVVVMSKNGDSDRAVCNQMVEINLDTGKQIWRTEVEKGGLFDDDLSMKLTFVGENTLVVGRSQSGVAYDRRTGKKLYDIKEYGASCFPSSFAGSANTLISAAGCAAGGDKEHDEVRGLDPRTGHALWTRKFPKGWRVQHAYSVNPPVLYLTNEDKNAWNITTLNNDGTVRSEVRVDEHFEPECDSSVFGDVLSSCLGAVASTDTLYLPTKGSDGSNDLVAISLNSGKERWRAKSPKDRTVIPLRIDGGNVVAYAVPTFDTGGQVLSYPATGSTHQPVKLLQNPPGAADTEQGFFSKEMEWTGGRLFISVTRLSGQDDAKEKLMMAFGK